MTEEKAKEVLAVLLKQAMIEAKLNNAQLAAMINVDKATVGRWLNGEKLLKINVIADLCKALDLTPNMLFGFIDKNTLTPKQYKVITAYEASKDKAVIDRILNIEDN